MSKSERIFGLDNVKYLRPKYAAAVLVGVAGKDSRAPAMIRRIAMQAQAGKKDAIEILGYMRRFTGSAIADDMVMGGLPPEKARALLPALPLKMAAAADLLTEARRNDPNALRVVRALKQARTQGENAKVRLRTSDGQGIILDAVTMERAAAVLNAARTNTGERKKGSRPGFLEWR